MLLEHSRFDYLHHKGRDESLQQGLRVVYSTIYFKCGSLEEKKKDWPTHPVVS